MRVQQHARRTGGRWLANFTAAAGAPLPLPPDVLLPDEYDVPVAPRPGSSAAAAIAAAAIEIVDRARAAERNAPCTMSYPFKSKYSLPSAWETRSTGRNQAALALLKIDGVKVKYVGPGEEDSQAASVRAQFPVPPDLPLYYFEMTVVSRGDKGFIGVGFACEDVQLGRLPGWEGRSYGYHGDDGHIFHGSGRGTAYGALYGTGDVVGALLDRTARTISFFVNGIDQGVAFRNVSEEGLRPTVGLRSKDEEVTVNFGSEPFRTDLAQLQAAQLQAVLQDVRRQPLPFTPTAGSGSGSSAGAGTSAAAEASSSGGSSSSAAGSATLLPQLILEYLVHHRCWRTAEAVARDMQVPEGGGGLTEEHLAEMRIRQDIYDDILAGRTAAALAATNKHYGVDLLSRLPRLHFKLKCQCFVDMLPGGGSSSSDGGSSANGTTNVGSDLGGAATGVDAALQYGRTELGPMPKGPADEELLSDVLSLLAYERPSESPCGYVLQPPFRQQLAEELNSAIMRHKGRCGSSTLDAVYKQARVALAELQHLEDPKALLLDVDEVCFAPPPPSLSPTPTPPADGKTPMTE